jgi:glutaredoxin
MKLELYFFKSCPYCQKVLSSLEGKDHSIALKDTRENENYYKELKEVNNGITQVPCLVIDGKPMLESDDIIEFLKNNI